MTREIVFLHGAEDKEQVCSAHAGDGMVMRSHGFLRCAMSLFLTVWGIGSSASFAKSPSVGEVAPAFDGTDFNGNKISLDDLRGEVIIVNFWATWCGPCMKELPLLDSYFQAAKDNGLRVVAVTTDADNLPFRSKKVLKNLSISLTHRLHGPYTLIDGKLPTNYIIDRTGVVRYAQAGELDLDTMNALLVPLLNEVPAASAIPTPVQ